MISSDFSLVAFAFEGRQPTCTSQAGGSNRLVSAGAMARG
jgi:hypothetical protein